MADFEAALNETRASVTEEMLDDYAEIQETLKSRRGAAGRRHRLRLPGMLQPRTPARAAQEPRR